MVAGWFHLDDPWDTIRPWVDAPLDDERARAATSALRVLISNNDRFTSDYRSTRAAFESRLGASVRVIEGRNHFNDPQQPEVRDELLALCGAAEA